MNNHIIEFYNNAQYANNILNIICYFNDSCNYRCAYCCNDFPRTNQFIDIHKLISYVDLYYNEFKRPINLIVLGGEPTLHPGLYEFCNEISRRSFIQCTVLSNFSADVQLYKNILELDISLILSWHSINTAFIDKLRYLTSLNKSFKKQIYVALMFESNFQHVKNIVNDIQDLNIDFNLIYIVKPYKCNNAAYDYTYTLEQLLYYKQINSLNTSFYEDFTLKTCDETCISKCNRFFSPNETITAFKMYKCYAGKDEIYIHSDGKIYQCEDSYRLLRKHIGVIDVFDKSIFKHCYCKIDTCGSPFYSKKIKILKH